MVKAAFNFVFGLQLEKLPSSEHARKHASRNLDGSAMIYDREWEAVGFTQPYFSLTGQVPTHIYPAWR
ncbi:hypothetical protein GY45DRAFT_1320236 [Cubamyces sp. BRFM 1775]|nr:hypothetical protein GY45DRAFT_1320236 [Cubamyces sp. BRFM 1775]